MFQDVDYDTNNIGKILLDNQTAYIYEFMCLVYNK